MKVRENILICPLNWGLGHASRCIPVIKILVKHKFNVVIAASGDAYHLLKKTLPDIQIIWFEDYNIKYSKGNHLFGKISLQTPKIFFRILSEHRKLKKLIRNYDIDIVISDNRFGLWNKKVKTAYITHQIQIKSSGNHKVLEWFLFKIHRFYINKFDVCWVPDDSQVKLAGELSGNTLPGNAKYIGILSRFGLKEEKVQKDFDLCVILSGPEPQRSIFEEIVLQQLQKSDFTAVVILGQPAEEIDTIADNRIHIFSSLPPEEIQDYIQRSEVVLARSGYSTIMDLATLGKKAILLPTPGQTEQEYLANYLSAKNIFYCTSQNGFDLHEAFAQVKKTTGILCPNQSEHLERVILESIS
jgi:uncharacterized protein (TIGR00661 family)